MKQKTYEGWGIANMLNTCKRFGLTRFNSDLHLKDPKDLDTQWRITIRGQIMENIQSIIEWHTKTFPDATLTGQKAKFDEEITEYEKANTPTDIAFEMADLFIVACGIARFDNIQGMAYMALV